MIEAAVFLLTLIGAQEVKKPSEVDAIAAQALAVAPEFGADVLLRLAASSAVTTPRRKRELVEQAFTLAAGAQTPYRRYGGPTTDERSTHDAGRNNLETLSLRTRAIELMLGVDSRRGLEMFEEIGAPAPPNPACDDPFRPDVSAYYATAVKVYERGGFTPRQRRDGEPLRLLESAVRSMASPAQVPPVMKMISDAPVTRAERQTLWNTFAVTLAQVNGSDRVFGPVETLLLDAPEAAAKDGIDLAGVMRALRGYIARHVSGPRCANHLRDGGPTQSVREFNAFVQRFESTDAAFRPIAPEEHKPLRIEPGYKSDFFWESPRSKQVLAELRWLNHGNRNLPGEQRFWTLEERSANEWNSRYLDALKVIEGWAENEESSPANYFCTKALTYMSLVTLVPPGPSRDNALRNFLGFLEQNYASVGSRNDWYTHVDMAMNAAKRAKGTNDTAWLLDEMARSANPAIALYARIEKLAPR
jgi:hypothetical protein